MKASDKRLAIQGEVQECVEIMGDLTRRLENLPWDMIEGEGLMAIGDAWLKLTRTMSPRPVNRDAQGVRDEGSTVAEPVKEESNPLTEQKKGT